ncbi:hypothetical protein FACS1894190_11090 [Spirochaetia bacterium]|nr:hypothetical protein FACS1894190_11090 [Spirochaetia bacterium]
MKQIIFWGLVFSFFVMMSSCAAAPATERRTATPISRSGWWVNDDSSPKYLIVKTKDAAFLYPGLKNLSPQMKFSQELLDASDAALRDLFTNTLYDGDTVEEYSAKLKNACRSQYYELLPVVSLTMAKNQRQNASYNWYYNEVINGVVFPEKIVVDRNIESYTGGAHPNHLKTYYVLDTGAMKQVSLDDVILKTSRPALQSLIEDALRKKFRLAAGSPLKSGGFFEDTVEATENFFLTEQGLGFAWDQYEIAPYVTGQIEIVLPRENVLPFLTEKGKALLPPPDQTKK